MIIYIATDANGSKHAFANVPYRSNCGQYWQGWGCVAIPLSGIDYSELEMVKSQKWTDDPYMVEVHLTKVNGAAKTVKDGRFGERTDYKYFDQIPMFIWIDASTKPEVNKRYLVRDSSGNAFISEFTEEGWEAQGVKQWMRFEP